MTLAGISQRGSHLHDVQTSASFWSLNHLLNEFVKKMDSFNNNIMLFFARTQNLFAVVSFGKFY